MLHQCENSFCWWFLSARFERRRRRRKKNKQTPKSTKSCWRSSQEVKQNCQNMNVRLFDLNLRTLAKQKQHQISFAFFDNSLFVAFRFIEHCVIVAAAATFFSLVAKANIFFPATRYHKCMPEDKRFIASRFRMCVNNWFSPNRPRHFFPI